MCIINVINIEIDLNPLLCFVLNDIFIADKGF